jgi:Beta/Gamma crystallin
LLWRRRVWIGLDDSKFCQFFGTLVGVDQPVSIRDDCRRSWSRGYLRRRFASRDGACFFTSANFSGDYFCQPRGTVMNVPEGFNDKIGSIQVYGRVTITIFNDANYQGFSAVTRSSIPDLRAWRVQGYSNKDWNNRISSIRPN